MGLMQSLIIEIIYNLLEKFDVILGGNPSFANMLNQLREFLDNM